MEGKATEVNRLNHAATPATPPLVGTKASAANEEEMNIELILKEKKSQIAKLQADVKAIEKVMNLLSNTPDDSSIRTGSMKGITGAITAELQKWPVGSTFTRKEFGEIIRNQFPGAGNQSFNATLSNVLLKLTQNKKLSASPGGQGANGFRLPVTYTKL